MSNRLSKFLRRADQKCGFLKQFKSMDSRACKPKGYEMAIEKKRRSTGFEFHDR
jgi:hypothetical protein